MYRLASDNSIYLRPDSQDGRHSLFPRNATRIHQLPAMATPSPSIVPAQLGFLAIYNPSLGTTDDTIDDQIVYYASVNSGTGLQRRRHRSKAGKPTDHVSQEERNERLRQIGLAQGMVEFSRSFSGDKPVDTIETEKTRVVLHELEPGWWILAVR